jgi:protein-S-isoprenylcysteine O-methyltransferase Ste14
MSIDQLSRYTLLACWIAFAMYWLVASFRVKKAVVTQGARSIFWFRIMQVANFVLLAGVLPYPPFDWLLWRSSETSSIGAAVCCSGTALAIWARRTLAANWSSSVTFKEHHELITDGPYAIARHPIYSGLLLMMLGTVLVLGRLDSLIAFITRGMMYVFKIRREERLMEQHFPDQYPAYRARVRALMPVPKTTSSK